MNLQKSFFSSFGDLIEPSILATWISKEPGAWNKTLPVLILIHAGNNSRQVLERKYENTKYTNDYSTSSTWNSTAISFFFFAIIGGLILYNYILKCKPVNKRPPPSSVLHGRGRGTKDELTTVIWGEEEGKLD